MTTDTELRGELLAELHRLRRAVPELTGCLVASTDGLLIVEDAESVVVEGVAALRRPASASASASPTAPATRTSRRC